jgi:hypothetical protein
MRLVAESQFRGFAAALVAALLLAACQLESSPPLLSPIDASHDYGYSEKPLGEQRYAITYQGPRRIAAAGPEADRSTSAALQQASDLAIWRAALLAKSAGYEGFRLTERQAEVNTHPGTAYNTATPCGPFQSSYQTDARHSLGGFAADYSHSFAECNHTGTSPWLQAHASIEIALLHAPGPSDYVADTVLSQMQQAYPGADRLPYSD